MKINQKELSRRYNHLNGKYIEIYVGVKKSPLKMVVYDLSIIDKSSDLVKYDKILVKIVRTNFNGTYVTLFIDYLGVNYRTDCLFKIHKDIANNLLTKYD